MAAPTTTLAESLVLSTTSSRYFGMDLMGLAPTSFATYEARMSMASDIVRMFYTMNRRTYDERIWHRMRLDDPQLWTIKHVAGQHVDSEKSHNWHIHAYHFQIDHAVDAYNNTYTESPAGDWKQGDWRDTVSVPRDGHVVVRFMPHTYARRRGAAGLRVLLVLLGCC